MTLVVSAPDVYNIIEFPVYELVIVIGYIRCKIRRSAICAYQDVVFLISHGRRRKPGGIFSFCCTATILQHLHRLVKTAAFKKALLAEPLIKLYTQNRQVFFYFSHDHYYAYFPNLGYTLFLRHVQKLLVMCFF